jgi:hypothetical protein
MKRLQAERAFTFYVETLMKETGLSRTSATRIITASSTPAWAPTVGGDSPGTESIEAPCPHETTVAVLVDPSGAEGDKPDKAPNPKEVTAAVPIDRPNSEVDRADSEVEKSAEARHPDEATLAMDTPHLEGATSAEAPDQNEIVRVPVDAPDVEATEAPATAVPVHVSGANRVQLFETKAAPVDPPGLYTASSTMVADPNEPTAEEKEEAATPSPDATTGIRDWEEQMPVPNETISAAAAVLGDTATPLPFPP